MQPLTPQQPSSDRSTYWGMGWGRWGMGEAGGGGQCEQLSLPLAVPDTKSLCTASFSHFNCSHWSSKLNPCTQLKFLEFKPQGVYMAYCDLNKKTCHLPAPSTDPCVGQGSMITSPVHKREEWETQRTLVRSENACPAAGRSLDEPQFCFWLVCSSHGCQLHSLEGISLPSFI